MKHRGESSKGKTPEFVSIPDSPTSILKPHGTALTFRSPKFSNRFQRLMMNKTFVYGKSVDPVLFHQIGVSTLFESVGLEAMLTPSPLAYPILLKQFFGNMTVKSDKIVTFVQNKVLSIDSELLSNLFHIPCSGECPFTLKGPYEFKNFSVLDQLKLVRNTSDDEFVGLPTVVDTTPINSVIHKIIRANLVPRTGGRSDMTFQDLILSALILSGTKFNFALFMIKNMESCIKNKQKCFPYGGFITKIFEHFEISFANEDVVQITDVIDEANLHRSMLKVSADGLLFWDIADFTPIVASSAIPSPIPSTSTPPHPPGPTLSDFFHLLQSMDHKLDTMSSTVHSLSNKVAALDTKLQDLDKKVEEGLFETVPVPVPN